MPTDIGSFFGELLSDRNVIFIDRDDKIVPVSDYIRFIKIKTEKEYIIELLGKGSKEITDMLIKNKDNEVYSPVKYVKFADAKIEIEDERTIKIETGFIDSETVSIEKGDSGMLMNVNVPIIPMTKAEFEALSTEDKAKPVVRVLTDVEVPTMCADGNPVGTILAYMGTKVPYGYLLCDGSEYAVEDYPELARFFVNNFGEECDFLVEGQLKLPNLSSCSLGDYSISYLIKYTELSMGVG